MNKVVLLGAGKIGSSIAHYLTKSGDYDVLVIDQDDASLERVAAGVGCDTVVADVSNEAELAKHLKGRGAAISAVSFAANPAIARAALDAGVSYFDLTEDVETTRAVRDVSKRAKPGQIFMPQCGLAPGFVSIAAHDLAKNFDHLDEVRLRVGALPVFPTNEMKYNLTWSTDGLINEYGNPCEAIHEGKKIEVLPLEGLEHFSLDGIDYEAFNTSGGVGTLAETLEGKARHLNYKTIRYRGHRNLIAFLMNELRMNHDRPTLKRILENAVPITPQDVVLIFCTVTGLLDGRFTQLTDARKVYAGPFLGMQSSAIQLTTAAGISAAVDLHFTGKLPTKGFVMQEQVTLPDFLANRFGKVYDVKATAERVTSPTV